MSQEPDQPPQFNPYASPSATPGIPPINVGGKVASSRELLRKFRQQILALGVLWIIFGVFALAVGIFFLVASDQPFFGRARVDPNDAKLTGGILLLFSAIWFATGIGSCVKQIWAVYVGLVLSYLGLVNAVFSLNICSGIITLLIIIQAHRVVKFAKQLRHLGIPLTARPEAVQ